MSLLTLFQLNLSGTGAAVISPPLLANDQVFYAPEVTTSYALTAPLYTNTQTFYNFSIAVTRNIDVSLFINANTLYSPAITATYNLAPSLVTDGDQFYSATVNATYGLAAPLIPSGNVFFAPEVIGGGSQATGGSLIRPRKRFRPAILLPFEKKPKPLPVDAVIKLPWLVAESVVTAPNATGEINLDDSVRLDYTRAETYISDISARSGWNDPTDFEIALIAELLLD